MLKDKFVYWGGFVSGKVHIKSLFEYNSKTVADFGLFPDIIELKTGLLLGNKISLDCDYFYIDIDNNIKRIKKSYIADNPKEYQFTKNYNFNIDTSGLNEKFNPALEKVDKEYFENYNRISIGFDIVDDFINKSDLIISPMSILGFNRERSLSKLYKIKNKICNSKYAEYFKSTNNYHPFKSNISELFLHHIGLYGDTLFSTYEKSPEKIWRYIDMLVKTSRHIELIMIENKIPYKHFDLDNDDYITAFGVNRNIPITYSKPDLTVKNKEDVNYAKKIVNEYITIRKIKTIKLSGESDDNIL